MGQTGATITYVKNGNNYIKSTNNVYKSNNSICSNFGNQFTPTTSNNINLLPYKFNKNTIKNASELIIKRDLSGNITGYLIDFNLSTTVGIQEYAQTIKDSSGGAAKSLPIFSVIKMHVQIDANGQLKRLQSYEVCTMNVGITATLTNNFDYIFENLENAPNVNLPNI